MQNWKKYILISDILSLYLALVLALIVRGFFYQNAIQDQSVWLAAHIYIFLPSVLFSILALYVAGLYEAKTIYDRTKTIVLLLYAQAASAVFAVISFYILRTELTPKLTLFLFVIISILLLSFSRGIFFKLFTKIKKPIAYFLSDRENLAENLYVAWAPYQIQKVRSSELVSFRENRKFKDVIIYDEQLLNTNLLLLLENLRQKGISVYSYNQYYEFLHKKVDIDNIYLDDLIRELGERKEGNGAYLIRRSLDILISSVIFLLYLFFLPFVKLGIYLQDKGEVYSKQNRVGFLGKNIFLWKIRTMTFTDNGVLRTSEQDKKEGNKLGNKYTKFGLFLRKVRIDELPQVINLFMGDVTLIGPRSLVFGVFDELNKKIPNFSLRLLVPQGLIGWALIHMHYNPKTFEEEKEKFAYDLYYIKHRSIFLDLSIILKTIKTILSREGA